MPLRLCILIAFLNQVFKGKKKILDVTYQQTVHTGDTAEARSTVFDIRCTGAGGEEFIIEMQRAAQPHFSKRMLCYSSALVTELSKRGQLWNFNLPEIYIMERKTHHCLSSTRRHRNSRPSLTSGAICSDTWVKWMKFPYF